MSLGFLIHIWCTYWMTSPKHDLEEDEGKGASEILPLIIYTEVHFCETPPMVFAPSS